MTPAALAAVLLAVTLPVLAACGSDDEGAAVGSGAPEALLRGDPTAGWTVSADATRGVQVSFPSGWRRARRSLTPNLWDPRELLSLGTGPLVVEPKGCGNMPAGALSALRAQDVLVSLQERRDPGRGYPPRPARFRLTRAIRSDAIGCLSDPARRDTWWTSFRDGDRAFYALVALGRPASAARRREAELVLDSLRFTPSPGRRAG